MLMLALDTSTPAASVALARDGQLLAEGYLDVGVQHAGGIFLEMERLLRAAAAQPAEVDAVAVSSGPGSFTGLRIGMSAAKGFCLGTARPLVTVPTLQALAAALTFARHPVCAMLDARKGEVYAGLFDCSEDLPRPLGPAAAARPQRVLADRAGQPTIYVGDGTALCAAALAADPAALVVPWPWARPTARLVARLGLERLRRGEVADAATAEPDYLRAPDARVSRPSPAHP